MVSFIPTLFGVSTSILDMTDAVAPFLGIGLAGLSLISLAGIVVTVLVDRWQMRRLELDMVRTANAVALSKAA